MIACKKRKKKMRTLNLIYFGFGFCFFYIILKITSKRESHMFWFFLSFMGVMNHIKKG